MPVQMDFCKYFLHLLVHKLEVSCNRVLCTGSDTAQIEKA